MYEGKAQVILIAIEILKTVKILIFFMSGKVFSKPQAPSF
jgi:hypothetical protein